MKAEFIRITDIVNVLPERPVISIAGAGGKTTLMFALASLLPGTVVLTTTTKVGENQIKTAETQIPFDNFPPEKYGKRLWVSPSLQSENGKIIGLDLHSFTHLAKICRNKGWSIIAETDGAACKHIKAPADHEPVIPIECSVCFYVVGLDILNKPLSPDIAHRPEIINQITGLSSGAPISPEDISVLMDHPLGGLKNVPENAMRIAYLTHVNTNHVQKAAQYIAEELQNYHYVCIS